MILAFNFFLIATAMEECELLFFLFLWNMVKFVPTVPWLVSTVSFHHVSVKAMQSYEILVSK